MDTVQEMRTDMCVVCGTYTVEGDLLCPICLRKSENDLTAPIRQRTPENDLTAPVRQRRSSKISKLIIGRRY